MTFQNPVFAYFLLLLFIPIIIFILQRFLLPSENIPSLIYILEQNKSTESYLYKELLKLILQLLILFFLIAGAGNLICSSPKGDVPKEKIAIIDNTFPLSKTLQGERPALYHIKRKIDKLGISKVFLLSELLSTNNYNPVAFPDHYYNAPLDMLDSFSEINKELLKKYSTLFEIHYFSPFCFSFFQSKKLKSLHSWVYYPVTKRKSTNLYFQDIKYTPDPMSAYRIIISGKVAGNFSDTKTARVNIVIDGNKQGLLKLTDEKRVFRFPIESKSKKIQGYLELKGDHLAYDNKHYFHFSSLGKIRVYIKGKTIFPLLKNVFEPDSVQGDTRFQVFPLKKQKINFLKGQTVILYYGNSPGFINQSGSIWFYNGKDSPTGLGKQNYTPLELEKGKKIYSNDLKFTRVLSSYKGTAKVLVEFQDGTPAVVQNSNGSIYVFFDLLSITDESLYSITFLYFMQDIINKAIFKGNENEIDNAELAKAILGFLPKKFGIFSVSNTLKKQNGSLTYAYNSSSELSSCVYPSLEELENVFPGKFNLRDERVHFWSLRANFSTLYFIFDLFLLAIYFIFFQVANKKYVK